MADDTSGKIKHVGGKMQEEAGELLGDREMQRKGKLNQMEGQAEQDIDRASDEVEEAVERKDAAKRAKEDRV